MAYINITLRPWRLLLWSNSRPALILLSRKLEVEHKDAFERSISESIASLYNQQDIMKTVKALMMERRIFAGASPPSNQCHTLRALTWSSEASIIASAPPASHCRTSPYYRWSCGVYMLMYLFSRIKVIVARSLRNRRVSCAPAA